MNTEKLKSLLEKYKNDSKNLDLINSIATWYMCNAEMCTNNEDYLFFERAYKIRKTVKSTHNFSSHLFYEYWEHKTKWVYETKS